MYSKKFFQLTFLFSVIIFNYDFIFNGFYFYEEKVKIDPMSFAETGRYTCRIKTFNI